MDKINISHCQNWNWLKTDQPCLVAIDIWINYLVYDMYMNQDVTVCVCVCVCVCGCSWVIKKEKERFWILAIIMSTIDCIMYASQIPEEFTCLFCFSPSLSLSLSLSLSGVLWMQKLKTHMLKRTQSSKVLHLKPGIGQNIAMHTSHTARDFFLEVNFYCSAVPVHSPAFFSPAPLPSFPVLAVANTIFFVGLQNKIDCSACRYGQLMQVPMLRAGGM